MILLEVYFIYKYTYTFMLLLNVREPAFPWEPTAGSRGTVVGGGQRSISSLAGDG